MASLLYQTIEGLSREKGIDPQIVVSAVEDAIVVATRKYYKSQENLPAQLAKQVIFQKVREAERDTVYNEYIGRVGEIVTAMVKRTEGPDVIFEVGKTEARMP